MNAEICLPLASSWLRTAILMCDGTLSVEFKNGFCCNYRNSNRGQFWALAFAASHGGWLRQNLYKILPYQAIRLPCPAAGCGGVQTGCCANAINNNLFTTVTNGGVCNGSYPITYNGLNAWDFTGAIGTCAQQAGFALVCSGGVTWQLSFTSGIGVYTPTSAQCSPFVLVFDNVDLSSCGGPINGTVTVTQ